MLARAQAAQEIADLAGTTVEAVGFLDGVGSHPWVGARHVLAEHRRDGSQDDPRRIASIVHLEPWTRGVGKPLQMDRGPAVRVGGGDGLLFAQAAVESDRKDPRRVVVDRAAHAHDAIDVSAQGLGNRRRVARVQHDEPDVCTHRTEGARDRLGRHQLAATVRAVEHHAALLVPGERCNDIAALLPIRGAGRLRAVSAEVHDGGLQLA